MLSRKRQIMFEVLGRRSKPAPSEPRPRSAPESPSPRRAARRRRGVAVAAAASRHALFLAVAGVVVVSAGIVAYRVHRGGGPGAPALQRNVGPPGVAAAVGEPLSTHEFAVCVLSREYKNKTERRRAAEKVQEIVDFLGYHADPDFRDVRGQDHPGKEPGCGTFRVYVGSARSRSELVALKNKLGGVIWNKARPFQNATVRLIESAAAPPGSRKPS
jgi:hypothetical protein